MDIENLIAGPYETIMAEHDSLMEEDMKKNIVGKFHNPQLTAKQHALKKERYQIDCKYFCYFLIKQNLLYICFQQLLLRYEPHRVSL